MVIITQLMVIITINWVVLDNTCCKLYTFFFCGAATQRGSWPHYWGF